MVIWTYNGSTTLTAVCTGLSPSTSYDLFANDPTSSGDTATSDGSGHLTLTVTDIGGASAGDTFFAEIYPTVSGINPVACFVFKIGTSGGTDQSIGATWDYDGGTAGTGVVSVTFDSVAAITYHLTVDGNSSAGTVVGDGTSKTLTCSTLNYGSDTSFDAHLYHIGSTLTDAFTLFRSGVASAGSHDLTAPLLAGRVFIAFNDGPLEPNPTWTRIDGGSDPFPDQFVAGYDTRNGRQTLISQTETGTATVYCNDRSGLFDARNLSSPYFGKLSGRQILLQLYNPVTDIWEPQFRGLIDDYNYDIDGSAVDANGDPINASIQLECVDMFDFLNGYGLTPGLDGITPPTGMEDGVYYGVHHVDDRVIEILTDATSAGWVADMAIIASGNVTVIGVKYDPDESALTALRDAADAEFPFVSNIYTNRFGQFCFRGRYSRFAPDSVAAEPGSVWDFARWPLGDGKAIEADPTRGQIRDIAYTRSRADLINAALAYPQDIKPADMPGQVHAASTSITNYGKHQAPPMSDLLTEVPTVSGYDKLTETAKFAELLVENKKDPRITLTRLQLKSMRPDDPRAAATWGAICGADISHIVNVAVGYPGGTGLAGDSPNDDYYIEGRALTVRPLNPDHDYVECDLETSPAIWSMDTHGVFPGFS